MTIEISHQNELAAGVVNLQLGEHVNQDVSAARIRGVASMIQCRVLRLERIHPFQQRPIHYTSSN